MNEVLVNNAAILGAWPDDVAAMDDLEEVLKVNVVGVQNVTAAFVPLLRKGGEKKIINL